MRASRDVRFARLYHARIAGGPKGVFAAALGTRVSHVTNHPPQIARLAGRIGGYADDSPRKPSQTAYTNGLQ